MTTLYSVAGVRGQFRVNRRVRFRRRGGWRVTGVQARRGAPPWEVGDFVTRRSRHFVVVAPTGLAIGDLTGALESGYATMRDLLPRRRLQRRYLVLVAADAAQAKTLTTGIRGIESLAAIADSTVIQTEPARAVERVVGLRLVVVWSLYSTLPAEERGITITHELTHAVLAGSTSGRTPSWLREGIALYVTGDRRPAPAERRPRRAVAAGGDRAAGGRLPGRRVLRQLGRRVRDRRAVRAPASCSASTTSSTSRRCEDVPARGSRTAPSSACSGSASAMS